MPSARTKGRNTSAQNPVAWTSRRSSSGTAEVVDGDVESVGCDAAVGSASVGVRGSRQVTVARHHLSDEAAPRVHVRPCGEPTRHWVPWTHFLDHWGYLAVFVLSFISAMGIPVGAELAIIYGGVLASGPDRPASLTTCSLVLVIVRRHAR